MRNIDREIQRIRHANRFRQTAPADVEWALSTLELLDDALTRTLGGCIRKHDPQRAARNPNTPPTPGTGVR